MTHKCHSSSITTRRNVSIITNILITSTVITSSREMNKRDKRRTVSRWTCE